MDHRVLIIDDVPEMADLIQYQIRKHGFDTLTANSGADALAALNAGFEGIVILDLVLPDMDGIELLETAREINPANPVIIVTAHGTVDKATEAIKKGAYDFILKSEHLIDRLVVATKNAARNLELSARVETLSAELSDRFHFHAIISQAPNMQRIFETLRQVVDSSVTVLIQGESGTGKEMVARAIHFTSSRKNGPFVAINCAGIPATLLESELFGFERGAFTGAVQAKIGKFEAANRGTIFLDEISAMDLNLQSKLLRVLQEREIEPLGSNRKRKLDIRILSATNTDLLGDVKASRFREDLYYRLAVFPITLPPLRDRQGDVALLARHFTEKAAREEGKPVKGLSREAIDVLESYDFPGNVRELENIISHAVVVCQGEWIEVVDLPQSVRSGRSITGEMRALGRVVGKLDLPNMLRIAFPTEDSIPQLAVLEHEMIRYVHALCRGNVRRTAGLLGVSRPLIYRHLDDTEKPDGQA